MLNVKCSGKVLDELTALAEKNGWGVDVEETENLVGLRIYPEDFCVYELNKGYGDTFSKVERARKVLGRKIIETEGGYNAVKLDKGVQIGCTTITDNEAKAILEEVRRNNVDLFVGESKVEVSHEDGTVTVNGNVLSFDEVEEVAKLCGY